MVPTISNLNAKAKKLKDEIRSLESNIQAKEEENRKTETLKIQIERKVEQKLLDNEKDTEQYLIMNRKVQSIDAKGRDLKIKMDQFIAQVKSGEIKARDKNSWLRLSNVPAMQQEIKDLSHEAGHSFDELASLIESIALYYFYESEKSKHEKGNLISIIKGDKKNKVRRYEGFKKEKEDFIKSNAKHWHIQINSPFEFYIPDDFLNKGFIKKSDDLKNQIIASLLSDIGRDSVNYENLNAIFDLSEKSELKGSLREHVLKMYLTKDGYLTKSKTIAEEIQTLMDNITEKRSLSDMMSSVDELHERTFDSRRSFNRQYEIFYQHLSSINEKTKSQNKTNKGLYKTKVGEINPKILSLLGEMSDLTNLDNDENGRTELSHLLHQVKSTYPSLLENYKLGIHNQMIPISTTERWNFGKAGLVIGSRSSYISSSVANSTISSDINDILSLKYAQDAHVITHNHAKPWEITLTFFAATSFLDNISPLTSGGGYWKIYERNCENVLHHVLKLQDGQYIVRKKLLDLKHAGEIANSERASQNVVSAIENLYTIKQIREALQ